MTRRRGMSDRAFTVLVIVLACLYMALCTGVLDFLARTGGT